MKKIVLLLLLCLFVIPPVSSQETNFEDQLSGQEAVDYFTHRYKKKRGTARGFLFSGVGLMAIGVIMANGADDYGEGFGGVGLTGLGIASSLVSIPFYIKAGKFKRQAEKARAQLNLSFGTIRSPERSDLAVGLSYNF